LNTLTALWLPARFDFGAGLGQENGQISWFMATLEGCKTVVALWLHNCSTFDEKLEISGFCIS
jgi:hypothetical protein